MTTHPKYKITDMVTHQDVYGQVRKFFVNKDHYQYLFVYDTACPSSFVAAQCLFRWIEGLAHCQEFHCVQIQEIRNHLHINPSCRVIFFDPILKMRQLLELHMACSGVLIYNTTQSFHKELIRNPYKGLEKSVQVVSGIGWRIEELVFKSCYPNNAKMFPYMTTFDYGYMPATIRTSDQQLMRAMKHDHASLVKRYPDEETFAQDAQELGYRMFDDTERVSRLIFANAREVHQGRIKALYVNCPREDVDAGAYLLSSYMQSQEVRRSFDYWVLYDQKSSYNNYEVIRCNTTLDLVHEFSHVPMMGKASRVRVMISRGEKENIPVIPMKRWWQRS